MRIYRGLAEATGDAAWEDKAFGLLAALIAQATPSAWQARDPAQVRRRTAGVAFRVAAAARIDLGGGWTDTPPYSIERGGTVLNAAITLHGAHPITAEVCCLDEPRLILQSRDLDMAVEPRRAGEVLAYANPADPFALPKAALVLRGFVPAGADPDQPLAELLAGTGGLRLTTGAAIPMGSGLGTSSILAGTVLVALRELTGEGPLPAGQLFDEVLCLEQMLTTGGGWQDQVGGLTGGIKLVSSGPGLPQRITVTPVTLDPQTEGELAARLCLVYTGQQRLAKNLLHSLMSRWMAREPVVVRIQGEIAKLAQAMRERLLAGDLDRFGELLGEHWTLNKAMDPGCTNPFIDDLFETMGPYINGGKLAGAGGGGFAFVIARSPAHARGLEAALAARYPGRASGCGHAPFRPTGSRPGGCRQLLVDPRLSRAWSRRNRRAPAEPWNARRGFVYEMRGIEDKKCETASRTAPTVSTVSTVSSIRHGCTVFVMHSSAQGGRFASVAGSARIRAARRVQAGGGSFA